MNDNNNTQTSPTSVVDHAFLLSSSSPGKDVEWETLGQKLVPPFQDDDAGDDQPPRRRRRKSKGKNNSNDDYFFDEYIPRQIILHKQVSFYEDLEGALVDDVCEYFQDDAPLCITTQDHEPEEHDHVPWWYQQESEEEEEEQAHVADMDGYENEDGNNMPWWYLQEDEPLAALCMKILSVGDTELQQLETQKYNGFGKNEDGENDNKEEEPKEKIEVVQSVKPSSTKKATTTEKNRKVSTWTPKVIRVTSKEPTPPVTSSGNTTKFYNSQHDKTVKVVGATKTLSVKNMASMWEAPRTSATPAPVPIKSFAKPVQQSIDKVPKMLAKSTAQHVDQAIDEAPKKQSKSPRKPVQQPTKQAQKMPAKGSEKPVQQLIVQVPKAPAQEAIDLGPKRRSLPAVLRVEQSPRTTLATESRRSSMPTKLQGSNHTQQTSKEPGKFIKGNNSNKCDWSKRKCFVRHGRDVVEVHMDPDEPLLLMKQQLETVTGAPVADQIITFDGMKKIRIANDKSLRFYGANAGGFFTMQQQQKSQK